MQQEIVHLYKTINEKSQNGQAVNFGPCIATATANVINRFVFGERLDENDNCTEKIDIINRITQSKREINVKNTLQLRFLLFIIKYPFAEHMFVGAQLSAVRDDMRAIRDYLSAKVALRKSGFDLANEPSSYIEAYFKVIFLILFIRFLYNVNVNNESLIGNRR